MCLDVNGDLACDSGEPSATTGKDGSYKLDTSALTTAQIRAAHLLTVVPTTAKDADDAGKTLAEAGKSGFSLLAPAAAYVTADGSAVTGAVISPLTTLVAHDIITSQTPLATAQANVRARLGLESGVDLTQDFVAKKDTALSEKAQMLTVALGSVKAEMLKVEGTTDKEALLAAVLYLQTTFTQLKAAFDDSKQADSKATQVALVKKALEAETAKRDSAKLLAEVKKITSSTASSALALIEQGFYSADQVLKTCAANDSYCIPSYWKVQGSAGKITLDTTYQLISGAWQQKTSSDSNLALTSKGWVKENDCAPGQSATYSADSSGVTTVTFCAGNTERITARTVDAAGKTLSALGLKPPTGFEATTMPAGSQLYWLDFANTDDKYDLWTGSPVQRWTSAGTFASIADFIAAHTTTATPPPRSWDGLFFSFNAGGTSTGGTVSLWSQPSGTTSRKVIGQAKYSIRTVHGQQMLVIEAPVPDNDLGELVMFAVKGGYLYSGSVRPASAKGSVDGLFNKTMINAILAAGKKPAVKD